MKVIQITDLHISRDSEHTFDIDVERNFQFIFQDALKHKPEFIVITGDFCFKGPHPEIFKKVHKVIETTDIPVYFLMGNHDDYSMMRLEFNLPYCKNENSLHYIIKGSSEHFLVLDTWNKRLDYNQLGFLQNFLNGKTGIQYIFMHHPPILCDVPYMDLNHSFLDTDKFLEITDKYDGEIHIFCGHYHVDKIVKFNNLTVNITPSTYFQISQFERNFAVGSKRIGYRIIEFNQTGYKSLNQYFDGFTK
jgi:Icc protein